MSVLRVQVSSWQSAGQTTDGYTVGDAFPDRVPDVVGAPVQEPGVALTGTVTMRPTAGGLVADEVGALHHLRVERVADVEAPWSFDLLDPTTASPSGWGWVCTIAPLGATPATITLTAALIRTLTQTGGVRVASLPDLIHSALI